MKRNIILISITILFGISTGFMRAFIISGKPEEIKKLEVEQKSVNEKYITAQILSQSLDNVYNLFESNLSFEGSQLDDKDEFMDYVTTILKNLEIKVGETNYPEKSDLEKSGNYLFAPYTFEIECDYEQFGKLISKLESSERLIIINEFKFNNTPENIRRSKNRDRELPPAKITMEIATITINKSDKK